MSDPTPAQGAPKRFPVPLWSDTRIDRLALDKLSYNGVMTLFTAKEIMRIMRDDYERILASLRYELAERDEQIANLPRQLQDGGWEVADREITINAMRARLQGEPATFDALGRYLYGEQTGLDAELANYIGEVIEYGENLCTRITEEWARYRELTGHEYKGADHAE